MHVYQSFFKILDCCILCDEGVQSIKCLPTRSCFGRCFEETNYSSAISVNCMASRRTNVADLRRFNLHRLCRRSYDCKSGKSDKYYQIKNKMN